VHLDPTDANVRHLLERAIEGPVVMLNLLRFRDVADYHRHPELAPTDGHITGREAYRRYIAHTLPLLRASGGTVRFLGDGGHLFIGPADERWDEVLLVEQAGIEEFFAFASDPDYLTGLGHREAALADSRLLPIVERPLAS
jgi:hypothetical protein